MLRKNSFVTRIVSLIKDDTSLDRLIVLIQLENNQLDDHFIHIMERLPPLLSLYSIDITQDYGCTYKYNQQFTDHLKQVGYHIGNKS